MGSYVFDEEKEVTEEQLLEAGEISDEEEGFVKGYAEDEEEIEECAECGIAVRPEKKIVKTINGEEYTFCSKACADDFEESIKEE